MNKIILISDNQVDTDLFNNQIFLEDTQRSETLASPVSPIEIETKKEPIDYTLFIIIGILIILVVVLFAFILKNTNKTKQNKTAILSKKEENFDVEEIEIPSSPLQTRKKYKGITYATPTSLNEAIKQFINITKIK